MCSIVAHDKQKLKYVGDKISGVDIPIRKNAATKSF